MAASAMGPKRERQSAMLRAALSYAARGVPVFPCEPSGKRPLTKGGFWEATTDERRIRARWGRWPKANVGIPTGRASGLLVLDVDAGDGLEALAELELSRGQPPPTARATTHEGWHVATVAYERGGVGGVQGGKGRRARLGTDARERRAGLRPAQCANYRKEGST